MRYRAITILIFFLGAFMGIAVGSPVYSSSSVVQTDTAEITPGDTVSLEWPSRKTAASVPAVTIRRTQSGWTYSDTPVRTIRNDPLTLQYKTVMVPSITLKTVLFPNEDHNDQYSIQYIQEYHGKSDE